MNPKVDLARAIAVLNNQAAVLLMLYASYSDVRLVHRILLAQHNLKYIQLIHLLVIAEDAEFASAC